MKLKTSNTSAGARAGKEKGLRKWLAVDRKLEYSKRDTLNMYLKVCYSELAFRLTPIEFDVVNLDTRSKVRDMVYKKYLVQSKKLAKLISKKPKEQSPPKRFSNVTFYPRFQNLTSTQFKKEQISLLEKGFNYNLPQKIDTNKIENLGVETELALKSINATGFDNFQVAKKLKEPKNFKNT